MREPTRILNAIQQGDPKVAEELLPLVYDELRKLAVARMANEKPGQTLQSNRAAIGAKVRVRATINGQAFWQMREVSGGDGRNGQNSPYVHVGLGNATNADLVRIEWPSGTLQELENVTSKQFLTVIELARLQVSGPGTFRVQSWKGMAFEVQASTNLAQWSPVTTVTNLTGTLEFTDPDAANDLRRFYRTVLK